MKAFRCWTMAGVLAVGGFAPALSADKNPGSAGSTKEKLLGAWHLVSMEEPVADGKLRRVTDRQGMLIYTSDGHVSVQLMLPLAEASVSNDYVQEGYEASFGSYDVDEPAHTVTHHVLGSVTRGLVGKNLPRAFQFSGDGKLIIKSTRPDEHWSVTWQHY
jgi:hypothetical protein